MKLSKMSNKHWRNKLSEAVEAFVVLTQKAGSALDQVRETALIAHTLVLQAEPLVLNATEACHSFSSIVDSLGKIDAALTNLQAHVHQGVSHDKAMLDKIRDVAFNQKYPTAGNQVLPLIRKILRHDVVEDWHIEPAKMQSVMIHSEATPMVSEGLGGKVSVATAKICHVCQEEAHYTDLDTGKYLCGKHAVPLRPDRGCHLYAVPLRPDRGCHLCDALATHEDTNGSYLCAHHASVAGPGVLRPL